MPPIHPGEILREEFMNPRGLSQNAPARALNVPPRRLLSAITVMGGIILPQPHTVKRGTPRSRGPN